MSAIPSIANAPYHRPTIPITLSLIAGIVLAERFPGCFPAALMLIMASAVGMVICIRRARPARWFPMLAVGAAGYLALMPWISPAHGPDHVSHFLEGGRWRIRATVLDQPVVRLGRTRFVAAVDTLSRGQVVHPVKGKIRVTVMGEAAPLPGDRVTFTARLRAFRNFQNPGGFDYRRYMDFQGIQGSTWVRKENLIIGSGAPPASIARSIQDARRRLGRIIDGVVGADTDDAKAVLKALVYGDRSGIDDALRRRFNRAGVGHLLAISGLHVGIVAALAFACFRWLAAFAPFLLWRGWGRPVAAGLAMIPVVAYGMLAGMSPSTQRAEIMVVVFLAALMLGRSRDTLNTLALAALVILIIFPPALFSISFQLSFAAVLAIVVGMQRFAVARNPSARPAHRAAKRMLAFIGVSALAILGTAPVVLFYFNQTSLVGLAANVLLIPVVGFVAVPLGLISTVLAVFAESVAAVGFRLDIGIIRLALLVVDRFAALPFAALKTVTPCLPEIVLYYLAVWAVLNLRKTTVAPLLLAAVLALGAGDGLYWLHQRFWHGDLRVTAIDVGQGTSTLLEVPGGDVLLVDGGGFSDNRTFDMGRRVVAPLLWRKKIATVDILILSHPNADHLNGLIAIARLFHVRELWTNGDVNTTWGFRELMRVCRENGVVVRTVDAGMDEKTFGKVTLAVLHPPPGRLEPGTSVDQEIHNNDSLVVRASFGETAFLITGDIMARAEQNLVGRFGKTLASTVLFAPHHGSASSSSADLIAAVNPSVVVISAGAGNRFGFPKAEVLRRYRKAGCRILCTCTHGAVTLSSDGKSVHETTVVHSAAAAPL